ncbi:MAG TPA: hypothetical protein IAB00_02030 [Candidatus Avidehalobacter gallistercoris]|uniref:SCP domain-containing protein n=1 Tax=Candidatus Avidehalobacter gallistercoris TaxID=2840694 RepID=A0A9D1HLC3_9FIRM|nr:hypothetical protein [Candidatus Avidehalobacter gallistercoris]
MKKSWTKKIIAIALVLTLSLALCSTAFAYSYPYQITKNWWNYNWSSCWQSGSITKPGSTTQNSQDFWQQIMDKIGGGNQQEITKPSTPTTPDTPDTPTTPDSSTNTNSSYIEQVVTLVNQERAKQGLSPVTLDSRLSAAAQVRAKEAAQSFSHTRPNGTSCFTALQEAGVSYRGAGENIAYGQQTPAAVMKDWMNSSGHRANILKASYTKIGVGYTVVNGTPYWSQFFTY